MQAGNMLKLYKYRSVSGKDTLKRTLEIISSGKIWYAKPLSFNDPFDCGLDLCDDMTKVEKLQVLREQMKREGWSRSKIGKQLKHSTSPSGELNSKAINNIVKLKEMIHKNRDNIGVLSLSRNCDNILMWSHYASEHKGVCIEFAVPVSDSLHNVTYSSDIPQYTLYDIYVKKDNSILCLFTTKHEHWKYEEECRIILDRGDILHDIPGSITSIIFGLRTKLDDELLVRNAASSLHDVRFKRCHRAIGKFGVEIKDAVDIGENGRD